MSESKDDVDSGVGVDLECEEFLELVWGDIEGVWVDLPAKVGEYWAPWHHEWTGEADGVVSRRIDSCIRDGESLYFSAGTFDKRGRNNDDFLGSDWLWADLDECHPSTASAHGILPTIAWESSPGRYQALWKIDRRVLGETFDKLNQALSYFLGADHGGWDRTQVLRLPGTRNYKYAGAPFVRLLWVNLDLVYARKYIWGIVRSSLPAGELSDGAAVYDASNVPPRPMPTTVRALLRVPPTDVVEGERSGKLWAIECGLAEAGWNDDDIYRAVVDSGWNKWKGVGTGEQRLRKEIRKAINHTSRKRVLGEPPQEVAKSDESVPTDGVHDTDEVSIAPPWVVYHTFMAMEMPLPKWMIEDIWTAGSHGILGGEPKTSKTTLALALGLSVASGAPFLGKYKVRTQGPVLFVQEENAPWMIQDRVRKLAALYGLLRPGAVHVARAPRGALGGSVVSLDFPDAVPIEFLNNWGLDLTVEEHREMLWEKVALVKPALVVIDPLYLVLAGVDYDKARDLAPYLKWILALRNEFGCAVCLVHHFRKANGVEGRSGQRLLGSTTFHGFVDTALYAEQLTTEDDGWVGCKVEREFRSMAPQGSLEIRMSLGDVGALDMKCQVGSYDLTQRIVDLIQQDPGVTARSLAESLGVDKGVVLGRSKDSGAVQVRVSTNGAGRSYRLYPVDAPQK